MTGSSCVAGLHVRARLYFRGMVRPAEQCIFCGCPEVSKEDVFPQWISRALNGAAVVESPTFSWRVLRTEGDSTRAVGSPGSAPLIRVTARCVCEPCNNVWMSQLEEAAKPFVEPMVFGRSVQLSTADQTTVAFWVAKTAAALEYTLETDSRLISTADHHWMYQHRLAPPEMSIWACGYREPNTFGAWHHQTSVWAAEGEPDVGRYLGQLYRMTFVIHRLVFQAAGFQTRAGWKY